MIRTAWHITWIHHYWWCLLVLLHWLFMQGGVYPRCLQTPCMLFHEGGNCQDAPAAAVTSMPRSWRRWTRTTAALARRAAVCDPAELNAHSEGALLGKAVLRFGTPPNAGSCSRAIQGESAESSPLTPGLCSLRTSFLLDCWSILPSQARRSQQVAA